MAQRHSLKPIRDEVERYVAHVAMEVWGDAILKAGGRDWSEIKAASARSSDNESPQSMRFRDCTRARPMNAESG